MSTTSEQTASPEVRLLPPLMLTVGEVARRFGVSDRTVQRWCRQKWIRCFRAGRIVRIYGDSVAEAVRSGRLPGEGE